MSTPATPSSPTPAGRDRKPAAAVETNATPGFEDRMQMFWEKNSKAVLALVALIALAILGKGAWEYLMEKKERDVQDAFAAATTTEQTKAFIAEHPDHALAGVAQLRLADEAYSEQRYNDAIAPYERAAAVLKQGPLASRAKLGAAVSKLQAGQADGEAALKAFAADEKALKAYRLEAAYHLTSLAVSRGNEADAKTYSEQIMQLDPASPWTQRAIQLRASLPSAATADAAPASSDATGESASPEIRLPGK